MNEKTRQQLENILANVKLKTGIEFDIATVESAAGQDISDFSLQLAREWNIGYRTSAKKSLLLVLAVSEKTSFTRFSRSVQGDLPEGVLGEMGQRMRGMFEAGQFSEGLNAGVEHFVSSLAQKLGLTREDLVNAGAAAETATGSTKRAEASTPTDVSKPTDKSLPAITTPSPAKPAVSENPKAAIARPNGQAFNGRRRSRAGGS